MPFRSGKQQRWAHTAAGRAALGPDKLAEFDEASKGLDLPEKIRHDRGPGHHYRKAGGARGTFGRMERKGKTGK